MLILKENGIMFLKKLEKDIKLKEQYEIFKKYKL